jgi:hypothetical protein
MPESVRDRCTKSHEYIFLLTKSPKYFYDHVAVKEPVSDVSLKTCYSQAGKQIDLVPKTGEDGIDVDVMGEAFR